MQCKDVQDKLPEYLAEDLSSPVMATMHKHIEECPACRKEVDAYEKTWDALDAWEDYEPSPAFRPVIPMEEKKISFADWFLSLFSQRVPAWATAVVIMLAFFAGHFLVPGKTVMIPGPEKTVFVQAETSSTDLASHDSSIAGTVSLNIPRSTDLIPVDEASLGEKEGGAQSVLPSQDWDSDDKLERIDVNSVFNI